MKFTSYDEVKVFVKNTNIHTLLCNENKNGALMLCGINHGYSKKDKYLDETGVDMMSSCKSFFSDIKTNNYPFRERIVSWFSLWGYNLERECAKPFSFEKSLFQTNWLQTCTSNIRGCDIAKECIDDSDSFFETCRMLEPKVVFFFGSNLIHAFSSKQLSGKVESIFGSKKGEAKFFQKDIESGGKILRRFKIGFLNYENLSVVSFPHPTGSRGVDSEYIKSVKIEISLAIKGWWEEHKKRLETYNCSC